MSKLVSEVLYRVNSDSRKYRPNLDSQTGALQQQTHWQSILLETEEQC